MRCMSANGGLLAPRRARARARRSGRSSGGWTASITSAWTNTSMPRGGMYPGKVDRNGSAGIAAIAPYRSPGSSASEPSRSGSCGSSIQTTASAKALAPSSSSSGSVERGSDHSLATVLRVSLTCCAASMRI
jgi:hypothetical protein